MLQESRWEEPLMHLTLGNFRLMNAAGYFRTSITSDVVTEWGWRKLHDDTSHNENNYYQSAGRAWMLLFGCGNGHSWIAPCAHKHRR